MEVVGRYFEVQTYVAVKLGFELHTYAEVVNEAVVGPLKVEVLLRGLAHHAFEIVVVPSIAQTYTTNKVGVDGMIFIGRKHVAKVKHQVEV